jgi:hypothetical protein
MPCNKLGMRHDTYGTGWHQEEASIIEVLFGLISQL